MQDRSLHYLEVDDRVREMVPAFGTTIGVLLWEAIKVMIRLSMVG